MPSRPGTLSRIVVAVALATASIAYAQGPSKDPAAAAIGEAIQQGETPYRPEGQMSRAQIDSAECRELAAQIGGAPKREYKTTGQGIETAQGRTMPELQRNRPRKELQEAYKAKCTP
ncbi:hypothetical protein [Cupriavidus sp. IDO]|uniref:hypothetical protein n=1 Tax=Cupriavidus sp. IDO TaxID=1539142 RepID=UPI0005798D84|nr:hypothetical protein [Cupriavidus sp. IDO]KWR90003.1 hypothetical protein RM96_11215 [Cupriavidus sp. IDO]